MNIIPDLEEIAKEPSGALVWKDTLIRTTQESMIKLIEKVYGPAFQTATHPQGDLVRHPVHYVVSLGGERYAGNLETKEFGGFRQAENVQGLGMRFTFMGSVDNEPVEASCHVLYVSMSGDNPMLQGPLLHRDARKDYKALFLPQNIYNFECNDKTLLLTEPVGFRVLNGIAQRFNPTEDHQYKMTA